MAANNFLLSDGLKIDTQESFLSRQNEKGWTGINYYPDRLSGNTNKHLTIIGKELTKVSFKDTIIENVSFKKCIFRDCLLIGAILKNCEFIDCEFYDTNTHKLKISGCLMDPKQFKKNFDLKNDSNIAVDFYQELYKNSKNESQPTYANDSLFMMNIALVGNYRYKYKSGSIGLLEFIHKFFINYVTRFTTGYGLRVFRIFITLLVVLIIFSSLNLLLRENFSGSNSINNFIDSLYFTCITVTTLGYGDVFPTTNVGKVIVIFESLVGFIFMSLFVSAFINRILRA